MPAVKNVTNADCDKRYTRLWWALRGVSIVLTLFAGIITLSFTTAREADGKAGKAEVAAGRNKTEMQTSFSFVREGIQRIEKKLDKINEHD